MPYHSEQRVPSTILRCVGNALPTRCTQHEIPVAFSSQSSGSWLSLCPLPSLPSIVCTCIPVYDLRILAPICTQYYEFYG